MAKSTGSTPEAGQAAPDIALPSGTGEPVELKDFRGQPVVVYFYPKDDTPGCTIEAQEFESHLDDFERAGAKVIGISPDDGKSHCKFSEKYGLRFTLLSDTEHEVAEKYGVWVEKNRYGRKYWGVQRATFLVDKDGRIAKAWPNVKPEGHAEEVLEAVKAL